MLHFQLLFALSIGSIYMTVVPLYSNTKLMSEWTTATLAYFAKVDQHYITIVWSLLEVCLLAIILSTKICFNSSRFLSREPGESNPYKLTCNVLKFAWKHKHPVYRSALTYWENSIPSRIDLGKRKYGGPFSNEEVENVKTFLHLIWVILSLLGILVTLQLIEYILQGVLWNHAGRCRAQNKQAVIASASMDSYRHTWIIHPTS